MHFAIGALAHTMGASKLLLMMSGGASRVADVEGTLVRMKAFILAGLAAPVSEEVHHAVALSFARIAATAPLFAQDGDQQLLTRPPVLQLSLKQAVRTRAGSRRQHARQAGRRGVEAGRVARR